MADKPTEEKVKTSAIKSLQTWGENPLPPTILATLITAQHMRPFQALPMVFPPVLLAASYFNVSGYKIDAAGITAAWSGLYLVLAGRRKQRLVQKFGARGIVRGATLALCAVNVAGCGSTYAFGRRKIEEESR
ncbi:hypothetical protein K432DRAFT_381309 [Lepidopterella palustris CBS 459.81]|uniref:Altered inheritance of mitochondria protein 19 n=1 Tax=Lepidopterella palustris CBS 459.81 TaxID=1314670 RepID=A0A8E2JG87_9PEZI|nr:hypothetical protein K432DRAFT_381309 [Lepidopterella palustris CBS 459.81]